MYVHIPTRKFMCICQCLDNDETKDHISISLLENVFGNSLFSSLLLAISQVQDFVYMPQEEFSCLKIGFHMILQKETLPAFVFIFMFDAERKSFWWHKTVSSIEYSRRTKSCLDLRRLSFFVFLLLTGNFFFYLVTLIGDLLLRFTGSGTICYQATTSNQTV